MAHGFNDIQLQHISGMIREGLRTEGQVQMTATAEAANTQVGEKTQELLEKLDTHYATKSSELEGKTAAMENQQAQILEILRQAEERHRGLETSLNEKAAQINILVEKLTGQEASSAQIIAELNSQEVNKERIITELNNRQTKMEQFKRVIESLNIETQRIVNEATGGWKIRMEHDVAQVKGVLESKVQEMDMKMDGIGGRMHSMEDGLNRARGEAGARAPGNGMPGSSQQGQGQVAYTGLIAEKDLRIPMFPSEKPSVD